MKSIQDNSGDLHRSECLICGNIPGENSIVLRSGAKVCASCLDGKETERGRIEFKIVDATKFNIEILYISFVLLICFCMFSQIFTDYFLENFFAFGLIWMIPATMIVLILYLVKKIKIKFLLKKLRRIIKILAPIYEKLWEIPPDWDMRKKAVRYRDGDRCSECGRIMFASPIVFHLHHVIPKKEKEGSHKINNLIFLCEDCHGYQSSKGHELLKHSRRYQYKYKHKLFPRKNRPIIEAWIEAYGIHKDG